MYCIVCNARKGKTMGVRILGLVDRAKTKQLWWTSDNPSLLIKYKCREAAVYAASRLKFNKALVVSADYAVQHLNAQSKLIAEAEQERDHLAAMDDPSWDAHKDWL